MKFRFFDFPIYNYEDANKSLSKGNGELRSTIIIISEKDNLPENITFLEHVLNAIKLNIDSDVSLLVINDKRNIALAEILDSQKNYQLLLFGLHGKRINFQINTLLYQNLKIQNISILFAHSLQTLSQDINKKKLLWNELKNIFL